MVVVLPSSQSSMTFVFSYGDNIKVGFPFMLQYPLPVLESVPRSVLSASCGQLYSFLKKAQCVDIKYYSDRGSLYFTNDLHTQFLFCIMCSAALS